MNQNNNWENHKHFKLIARFLDVIIYENLLSIGNIIEAYRIILACSDQKIVLAVKV